MKTGIILVFFIFEYTVFSQIPVSPDCLLAQEFSKEMSLFKAKSYLIKNILLSSEEIVQFEIDPLAASTAGEITSLVYSCKSKNLDGLLLGFYGDFWNDAGVVYKGYSFKNIPKSQALELLNKISQAIINENAYLNADMDNNNIYFKFDDISVLIYKSFEPKIRLFWNDFDADWSLIAFNRTKKRFEKSIK